MGPKRAKGKSADDGSGPAKRKKVDTEDTEDSTESTPKIHWQWEADGGIWTSYSPNNNDMISSLYNSGKKKFNLEVATGQNMEIDCDKMIQKNKKTKFQRRLRCGVLEESTVVPSGFYLWQWEDERGKWNPYNAELTLQMEEAKQKGDNFVNIVAASRSYTIDVNKMEQENTVTKVVRKVSRLLTNFIKQEEGEEPSASSSADASASASKGRGKSAARSKSARSGRVKEEPMEDDEPKTKSSVKKVVMKGQAPVDEDCPIKNKTHVFCEGKDIWDCMLNQTDVGNNNNKYYLIQILEDDAKKAFHVWQRWGRVGYSGQNNLVPCGGNIDNAKKVFCKKFSDKTRNDWSNRSSFSKVHGKYDLVKLDYSAKPLDDVDSGSSKTQSIERSLSIPDSKLDKRLQNLIELICDVKKMEDAVVEMEFDAKKAPLGRLTADQVKAGYAALKKIDEAITNGDMGQKLTQACNEFYTRIPHEFGMKPPTIIKTKVQVKKKIELLEALADIEIAIKMLKKGDTSENPVDRHYHALNCELTPVEKTSDEFKLVNNYVQNTHATTHRQYKLEVMELYSCVKDGEAGKFIDYGNRTLLWHGSRLTNWVGILSQGLRIAPPEAPVTGYMFGKGVYFADMSSKSANYAYPSRAKNVGLLTLCEVSLGQTNDLLNADYNAQKLPSGKHSVKGLGSHGPDPSKNHVTDDGMIVPLGKEMRTGVTNPGGFTLNYNEYIVYDVRQIKMKYLVKLKFNFK